MNTIKIFSEIDKNNLILESLGFFLKQHLKKSHVELFDYSNSEPDMYAFTNTNDQLIVLFFDRCAKKTLHILEQIKSKNPNSKVLIINNSKLDIKTVKEFKNFHNLILFNTLSPSEELIKLVNQFDESRMTLCGHNQAALLDNLLNEESNSITSKFSQVESNIVECADQGFSIIETAEKLQISSNTVAAYRSRILKKLGASSMLQAVTMMRNATAI